MGCGAESGWMMSNIAAIPEAQISGPPMSPSMAMLVAPGRTGTSGTPGSARSRHRRRNRARAGRSSHGSPSDAENAAKDLGVFNIAAALPSSIAPAVAPAILALGSGSYGVLYAVAGVCAILGAAAILPVKGVR
jgi:hypothetical protein